MDTRSKIIDAEEALRLVEQGATVVSGYFDPMIAEHAERLADLRSGFKDGSRLLVAIVDPANPILPSRARAELVAALRCVDFVVESATGLAPAIRLEAEDAAGHRQLVEHVHQRQGAAK